MAREEHVQAVGFAGLRIEEFEQTVLSLKEGHQECLGLVNVAVGDTHVASGQDALVTIASVSQLIDDIVRACEHAKECLNNYSQGF
jgi:hypothetical protein